MLIKDQFEKAYGTSQELKKKQIIKNPNIHIISTPIRPFINPNAIKLRVYQSLMYVYVHDHVYDD